MNNPAVVGAATSNRDYLLPFVASMHEFTGVSRATAYRLVNAGKVDVVKLGGSVKIRQSELDRFIASLPAYQAASRRVAA